MNDQSPLRYVYMIPLVNSLSNYVGSDGVSHRFNGGFVNKWTKDESVTPFNQIYFNISAILI
jgi:hypothetical protein